MTSSIQKRCRALCGIEKYLVESLPTRWAPTSYKWSYNPYKWPYNWVTGVITPISGVITILITGRGPTLYILVYIRSLDPTLRQT